MLLAPAFASAQVDGGGVTLNQYRAAPTIRDGFAVSAPTGLGHLALSARLDVDYAYEPLRVLAPGGGEQLGGGVGRCGLLIGSLEDRVEEGLRIGGRLGAVDLRQNRFPHAEPGTIRAAHQQRAILRGNPRGGVRKICETNKRSVTGY